MISIITLLDKVLSLVQIFIKKLQEKRAQDERDKLENDPFDFYVQHFDGVSDSSNKAKASETNAQNSAK